MLPATLAFVFFMYVTDQVMAQMNSEQQRMRAGVAFDRAERIITDKRVPDWQGRLKEIEKTFRVEHEIVPMARALNDFFMSDGEKERLRSGDIAFRDIPGGGWGVRAAPAQHGRGAAHRVRGCLPVPAHLLRHHHRAHDARHVRDPLRWMWPVWRDLQALTAATSRVGDGDFGVRAETKAGSMLQPIASAFNVMATRVQALLQSHRDLEQGVAHELRTAAHPAQVRPGACACELRGRRARPALRRNGEDVVDLEELVAELLVLANLRHAPPYAPRVVATSAIVEEAVRRVNGEMRGQSARWRSSRRARCRPRSPAIPSTSRAPW